MKNKWYWIAGAVLAIILLVWWYNSKGKDDDKKEAATPVPAPTPSTNAGVAVVKPKTIVAKTGHYIFKEPSKEHILANLPIIVKSTVGDFVEIGSGKFIHKDAVGSDGVTKSSVRVFDSPPLLSFEKGQVFDIIGDEKPTSVGVWVPVKKGTVTGWVDKSLMVI